MTHKTKIIYNLAEAPQLKKPIAFAVGSFDGFHLGHQHLIKTLKSLGSSVIFTFTNHPLERILPGIKVPLLTPLPYKLQILETLGLDLCILQPFSNDMANMSYQVFLEEIHKSLPFDHIVIGGQDPIGKNREGTKEKIQELGMRLGFTAHYIPKILIDGEEVSSTLIREFLKKGNLAQAEKYLGRPFATPICLNSPYIDPSLLKPGAYILQIKTEKDTFGGKGKVTPDGTVIFDCPSFIDRKEKATITFLKE